MARSSEGGGDGGGADDRGPLTTVEDADGRTAVVSVDGDTTIWSGSALDDELVRLKGAGFDRIVVDLSSAGLLNSKLLDALVRCSADLDPRRGAGLAVVTTVDYVRQILEVTESGGLLFLADTRDEALESLPAGEP